MGGSAAASTGFSGKTQTLNGRIHWSADGSRPRAEPCIPLLPCALNLLLLLVTEKQRWKTGREGEVNESDEAERHAEDD